MFENIRNVYCVGRNYALHAAELGNAIPESPMIFMKPNHALVEMNGQSIQLPSNKGEVHYETELVIHMGRPYEKAIKADEIVDTFALGIDFTLRDVQSELKKKGHPWLPAKGFLRSAPVSRFIPFPGVQAVKLIDFCLSVNETEVQRGNISEMVFDLQTIIDFIGDQYGLGTGDIIYTGTPAGVGAVKHNDTLRLQLGQETAGTCVIHL